MGDRPLALVLQHDRNAGPGLLGAWLADYGFVARLVRAPEVRELPAIAEVDLVVVLGSSHCANDNLEWVSQELDLVREAHRREIPLLGICFGGQLLARALGGRVLRSRVSEIGWREIDSLDRRVITPGFWFEWHYDIFEPPPHAKLLAVSEGRAEAFRVGRSLGVQFHPELDLGMVRDWARDYAKELHRAGIAPESLLEDVGEGPLELRASVLFDAIWARISAGSP